MLHLSCISFTILLPWVPNLIMQVLLFILVHIWQLLSFIPGKKLEKSEFVNLLCFCIIIYDTSFSFLVETMLHKLVVNHHKRSINPSLIFDDLDLNTWLHSIHHIIMGKKTHTLLPHSRKTFQYKLNSLLSIHIINVTEWWLIKFFPFQKSFLVMHIIALAISWYTCYYCYCFFPPLLSSILNFILWVLPHIPLIEDL